MRLILSVMILLFSGALYAGPPENFEQGKDVLYAVHEAYPVELYCGCRYYGREIRSDCPVEADVWRERLKRTEAEHMVAASDFGRQMACWQNKPQGESGRDYCRKVDARFNQIEGDPHNLWPAVGTLNVIRLNYRFGEVPGEERKFGGCDFEVGGEGRGRFIEPPDYAKGIVARAYFYMEQTHGYKIGQSQRRVLVAWNAQHPPTKWEVYRAKRIRQLTGLRNPILDPAR